MGGWEDGKMGRIEEIRARYEAATPGPWDYDEGDHSIHSVEDNQPPVTCDYWTGYDCGSVIFGVANAEFITHARDDIPWLLAENARLEAERDGAIMDIRKLSELAALPCLACKYNTGDFVCRPECSGCSPAGSHWKWRGAQPATGA